VQIIVRKLKLATGAADSVGAFELVGAAYAHGYMQGEEILEILQGERISELFMIDLH
jgi:hypothetical protein